MWCPAYPYPVSKKQTKGSLNSISKSKIWMAPQLATVDVTLNVHFMAGQCSAPPSDLSKELFSSEKKRDRQPRRQRITDISFSFSLITCPLAQVVILRRPSKKKKKKKRVNLAINKMLLSCTHIHIQLIETLFIN